MNRILLLPWLLFAFVGASPNSEMPSEMKPMPPMGESAEKQPESAELKTEHFRFLYDPRRMSDGRVKEAAREAVVSFKEVAALFPEVRYTEPITIRLDARFRGATGYATPGGVSGKGKRDAIGIRYEDLPTLGLTPGFLFRHELAHLFAGRWEKDRPDPTLSGAALGEGIADLVAGGRNRLGLPLSFAKYLQQQDAWAPPLRLFLFPRSGRPPINGKGPLEYEEIFQWRIARYVEPSLFLEYVRSRIGWKKMRQFYIDYTRASQTKQPADNIRTVIRRHTGLLPEELFAQWQAAIDQAPEEREDNRQRWLSERAYAGVQWYEFLILRKLIPEADRPGIDAQFRALHAEIAARRLDAAEKALAAVLERVKRVSDGAATQNIVRAPLRRGESVGVG
ncbi:MAG: hypothetical protein KY468_14120 [Armatimonadetes bacterium]|nr:hypothetical protein [Armatimonadota bacterium]